MKKIGVLVLLLVFLRVSDEMAAAAEARTCATPSSKFNGICARSSNCATVCQSEGWPDGACQGFRRRCMCQGPCPSE